MNEIFTEMFWYIAAALVPIVITISECLIKWFKIDGTVLKIISGKQLASWLVAIVMSVCVYLFGFLKLEVEPIYVGMIALSVVVGLSSNGIYDIKVIKQWVSNWFYKV